jgi:hypothetical protein
MSNTKKPKKLRTPNVPMTGVRPAASGKAPAPTSPATGARVFSAPALRTAARTTSAAPAEFDYSHIRRDLRRIGILAGSFIAVLVGLSFIIR